jgi:hypothetical protein
MAAQAQQRKLEDEIFYSERVSDDNYEYRYAGFSSHCEYSLFGGIFGVFLCFYVLLSHVILPKELVARGFISCIISVRSYASSIIVPKDHLMSEAEWRAIGICQSVGFAVDSLYLTVMILFVPLFPLRWVLISFVLLVNVTYFRFLFFLSYVSFELILDC